MDVYKALDLTEGEEKVYRALIKLRSSSTGPIYKKAGVSQSKVYQILDRLKKKGLAASIVKDGTRYWHPANPSIYLESLDNELIDLENRKQVLEKKLPSIINEDTYPPDDAQLLVGYNGFRTALYSFLETFKAGDEFFVIGSPVPVTEPFYSFVHAYNLHRAKKKIRVRFLYPKTMKKFTKKMYTMAHTKVRFVDFKTPSTILIGKDRIIIISWEGQGKCIVIMGKELTENYLSFFESLWVLAKK